GLAVPDDAMSLAAPDLNRDGRPDLSFGNNDAPMKGYAQSAKNGDPLVVRLEGSDQNPTAIGARVSIDGNQHSEVRAGSGYLSQSPPALYFSLGADVQSLSVTVRWPDGEADTFEKPRPASGELVLKKP
ncbi:MAG: ASPIC/UnbV domain-containing protein, partial [Verrucomicrobiales bacterium]